MYEPTGMFLKRVDDMPSNVDIGVGVGDNTRRKPEATLGIRLTDESRDGFAAVFNVVGAAGSGPDVINTSCHPRIVFWGEE